MKNKSRNLFAGRWRRERRAQLTEGVDAQTRLVDWCALASVVTGTDGINSIAVRSARAR